MMKGRPKAYAPLHCIQSMQQNEEAYISYSSIIFGRKNIYIDLLTPTMNKEDCGYEPDDARVLVTRIGKGLEQKDFEIDFSRTKEVFILATEKQTKALDRESHLYLILENTGFELVNEPFLQSGGNDYTIQELNDQLTKVLEGTEPDYHAAAILRDIILARQRQDH